MSHIRSSWINGLTRACLLLPRAKRPVQTLVPWPIMMSHVSPRKDMEYRYPSYRSLPLLVETLRCTQRRHDVNCKDFWFSHNATTQQHNTNEGHSLSGNGRRVVVVFIDKANSCCRQFSTTSHTNNKTEYLGNSLD